MRMLKVWAKVNSTTLHDEVELPDDWDEKNEEDKDEYATEQAHQLLDDYVTTGWDIIEES